MVLPGQGDFRAEEKTCRNCEKNGVDLLDEELVEAWVENPSNLEMWGNHSPTGSSKMKAGMWRREPSHHNHSL